MNENTVVTICWSVIFVFGISQFTIYSLVRLIVTGKPLFERKPEHNESRIVGLNR